MTRLGPAALALGLLAATGDAGAQSTSPETDDSRLPQRAATATCTARIPTDSLVRVPVFLEVDVADSSARPLLPVGDLLADLAATKVRAALGAAPGTLPAADSVVGWMDLTWLSVTLHRDGRFTWRPHRDGPGTPSEPRGAARLLASALEQLVAEEHRLFWPDDVAGDSATIEFHLHEAVIRADGAASPPVLRFATPVFSVLSPRMTPVEVIRAPRISYPTTSMRNGAAGTVILDFVVAADGTVEEGSIRDVWPGDRPRLTGELGAYYRAFLKAAERGVLGARYAPARIGPCPVRQLVRQQFNYAFRGR